MMKKIFTISIFLISFFKFSWSQTFKSYIDTDDAYCIVVIGDTIWSGSRSGVLKMDLNGNIIKTYTPSDYTGTLIKCIAADSSGNIWFGCEEGASKYHNGKFQLYTWEDGMVGGNVEGISTDKHGNVWFAHFGYGISKFDGNNWTKFNSDFISLYFTNILCDKTGNIWVTNYNGLYKFDGSTWYLFQNPTISYNSTISLYCTSDSSVWVGNTGGNYIDCYKNGQWQKYNPYGNISGGLVKRFSSYNNTLYFRNDTTIYSYKNGLFSIAFTINDDTPLAMDFDIDKNGSFWITKERHIERRSGSTVTHILNSNSILCNQVNGYGVNSVMVDDSGKVWVATNLGYCQYDRKKWKRYYFSEPCIVDQVTIDPKGRRWVIANKFPDAIFVYQGDSLIKTFGYYNFHNLSSVKKVIFDKKGFTWIMAYNRLYKLKNDSLIKEFTIYLPGAMSNAVFNDIAQDTSGIIWASAIKGVISIADTIPVIYESFPGIYQPILGKIFVDKTTNYIYFAGNMMYYTGTTWKRLTGSDGYDINGSTCILRDYDGSFWFGSYGAGLTIQNNSNWESIYTTNGLVSNFINDMIIDMNNNIWIATVYGLCVVERNMIPTTIPENKISDLAKIQLYPNPVTERIFISDISTEDNGIIMLFDIQGKCIIKTSVLRINEGIDVSSLKPGLYLITIQNNGKTKTAKFIKK